MPGNQEEYVDNPPYFQSDWELYKTDKNNSKNCSLKLKVVQYPKHIDKNESDKVSFNRVDSRKLSCLKGPTSQSWQPMSSQNKLIWLSHLIYQPHRDQNTEPQMCTVENCLSLEVCRGFVQQQDDKISLVSLFSFNDLSFVVRKVICQQLFVFFF